LAVVESEDAVFAWELGLDASVLVDDVESEALAAPVASGGGAVDVEVAVGLWGWR
jgi:hypothetical protein